MDVGRRRGRDSPLSRIPGTPELKKTKISKENAPTCSPRNKKRIAKRCCAVHRQDVPEEFDEFVLDLLRTRTDWGIRDGGDTLIVPIHTLIWMAREHRGINYHNGTEEVEETDSERNQNNA